MFVVAFLGERLPGRELVHFEPHAPSSGTFIKPARREPPRRHERCRNRHQGEDHATTKPKIEEGSLPRARAQALARREAELRDQLGYSLMAERESVAKEIVVLVRIIKSDLAALKMKKLGATDRRLLDKQIETRSARLKDLKRRLEGLSS